MLSLRKSKRRRVAIRKKSLKLFCLILLVAVLCTMQSTRLQAGSSYVVRVGVTHYPPWMKNKSGAVGGYDFEMLQIMFKQLGLEAEYVPMVFSDILSGLRNGDLDIATSLLFREDRNEYIRFISPPYRTKSVINFYSRIDSGITVRKYIDIAGMRVAVAKGARYFPIFDLDDRMVKVEYHSQKEAFKALAEKEVDLAVCAASSGDHYLRELGAENYIQSCSFSYAPRFMPVYIGVSRKSPLSERAEELGGVLHSMQDGGLLEKIAGKYSVSIH